MLCTHFACETLKYYTLMLHYLGTSIYLKFEWFSKDTHHVRYTIAFGKAKTPTPIIAVIL